MIYEGADIYKILESEAWKQRCRTLLQTYFFRAGQFSGVITFPDTRLTTRGKPWENTINTLIDWCAFSNRGQAKNNLGNATGLIIRNYDLKNHLNFCGITDDEIQAFLTKKTLRKKLKNLENIEKILVFNPLEKIILTIRIVGSQHHGQLRGEVFHCIDDVNLLTLLLKDELKDSGVIVTGLVVHSGENTHSQSGCVDCDRFIISSTIFNSVPGFDNFWKDFVSQNVLKNFTSRLETRNKSDWAILFEAVASKIVGYLAHLQFKILEKPVLPVPEKEPTGNIKQAELLLDRYQMEIAYSDNKRIFLTGNYGTGKTVVALKKLDLLYEDLKEKEVIYYVNFAKKSQLHLEVMEKNKTKEKVKVIRGGTSLSNIVNFKILPDEEKSNTKNIHLIVDEYDSQNLSAKESATLYQILQNKKQFKDSTVLIAVQPIEINRTEYFNTSSEEKEYSEEKHMFGKLEKIMKVFKLKHVMRTTVEINNLIEVTQSYLNNKTNQYEGEQENYREIRGKSVLGKLLPTKLRQSSKESNVTENKPKLSYQNQSASSNYSLNALSSFTSASPIHTKPIDSQEIIDHDELYKVTSTSSKKKKRNLLKVVTKYRYPCDSEIGHGINGSLPKLVKIPKFSDPSEEIVLIAFLLLEIIEIKFKRIAIIHYDKNEPLWFQLLFKITNFFPDVTVTNDVAKFIKISGNAVLVSNYNLVKGLEFSDVLLILDADEYHLKQFVPEAMARCINNLAILVRPKFKGNPKSDTVKDLVDHWELSNETGEPVLEILSLKFCSGYAVKKHENCKKTHCKTDKSKYTSYKIHKGSERYRDLSKTIKNMHPNLNLEEKKASEEAKAM